MLTPPFKVIVAHDDRLGIGKANKVPWSLSSDLKFFKRLSTSVTNPALTNALIMGRCTWECIPIELRPLAGRYNFVLSKNSEMHLPKPAILCRDFNQLFSSLSNLSIETNFLIGGATIFKEFVNRRWCNAIYATEIEGDFQCDRFFPEYRQSFDLVEQSNWQQENNYRFRFNLYM